MTPTARPPRTADAIRDELLADIDPKRPDEQLLLELAASTAAITFEIQVAAARLAQVLPGTLHDAKKAAAVVRVLHDLGRLGNVLVRRIEGSLTVASTLRLQRRLHEGVVK